MNDISRKFIIKPINTAVREQAKYLKNIKEGVFVPINTGYRLINEKLLGGLNEEDIVVIAGLSGSGKTAFALKIGLNVVKKNPNVRLCYLTFEIAAKKLIARAVTMEEKVSLKTLYNTGEAYDPEIFKKFMNLPIDFVEIPTNVDYIREGLIDYVSKYPNHKVVCIVDHSLLIEDRKGDNDMTTLILLSTMMNKLKKQIPINFILVSQLNNAMLNPGRLNSLHGQYPDQTDLFGSKYLFHIAENVIVLINPSRMSLPNPYYGKDKLPLTKVVGGKTFEMIYAHSLKTRDGKPGIDPLYNNLEFGSLVELSPSNRKAFGDTYKI